MATAGEPLSLNADLSCSACFQFLEELWSLTCYHIFCKDCVKKLNRVKEENDDHIGVLCPMCQEFCPEENIRTNFTMKNLIQAFANKSKITEKGASETICLQCQSTDVTSCCMEVKMVGCMMEEQSLTTGNVTGKPASQLSYENKVIEKNTVEALPLAKLGIDQLLLKLPRKEATNELLQLAPETAQDITQPVMTSFRKTKFSLQNLNNRCFQKLSEFNLNREVHRICFYKDSFILLNLVYNYSDRYNRNGQVLNNIINNITNTHTSHDLHPLNSEHLVAATDKGLIVINENGDIVSQLREGNFISVHVRGSIIAALCCVKTGNDVQKTLTLIDRQNLDTINQFKVNKFARFVLLQESQVVVETHPYSHTVITKYTLQGDVTGTFGSHTSRSLGPGYFHSPGLCMTDFQDSVLVVDLYNHRLQVLDRNGEWKIIKTDLIYPWDAVITNDGFMYVISSKNKLLKYKVNIM